MKRKAQDCVRLYATSELIRSLMQISGVTINELARQAGVSTDTAHRFTTGKLVDTSPELADKYADILRVRADLLFVPMRSTLTMEELAA